MSELEQGTKIESYKLPVIDVCHELRNFPGYKENTYFNLADIQEGDTSGATDSDLRTHKMEGKNSGGGYTKIYSKSNSQKGQVNGKRS